MPRKTKKQKLRAQLRNQAVSTFTYKFTGLQTPDAISSTQGLKEEFLSKDFVIKDIRKTLILTTLAILFELVLYLFWRS